MTNSNKEKMASQIVEKSLENISKDAQKKNPCTKKILSNIKKKVFSKIAPLILAGVMAYAGNAKAEELIPNVDLGVSAGVEYNFANPINKYYNDVVNPDYKAGKYVWGTSIPQWQDIQANNSILIPEIKGSVDVKIADGFKVGVNGGYKWGKDTNALTKGYVINYVGTDTLFNFDRSETYDINSPTTGINFKLNLSEDTKINVAGNLDFVSIKGNYEQNMATPSTGYIQNRKADYSGSAIIPSIEGGLEQKIIDGVSVNVKGGMKFGKVDCSGKNYYKNNAETPNWKESIIPYNPSLDFNNSYVKGGLEIKF